MEIRQIKYFLQVCNDKSFSKAAVNLHVTQQGLSKAIKNLEDELGTVLFDRSSKGTTPTEFGCILFERSQKLVIEFDSMVDFLYDKAKLERGTISIGLPNILYTDFFASIFCKFQDSYPGIKLEIVELGSYICEKNIENDLLDISFTVKPVNTEKFNFIPVYSCDMVALVNKENSLAQKCKIKLRDLENEEFIMLSSEYKLRQIIIDLCLHKGFNPNIVFSTSLLDLILELIALKKGIAILPKLNPLLAVKCSDKVSIVSFQDVQIKLEVGFITNKRRSINYTTKTLINYTLNSFKTEGLD